MAKLDCIFIGLIIGVFLFEFVCLSESAKTKMSTAERRALNREKRTKYSKPQNTQVLGGKSRPVSTKQ